LSLAALVEVLTVLVRRRVSDAPIEHVAQERRALGSFELEAVVEVAQSWLVQHRSLGVERRSVVVVVVVVGGK
jgi:hypothetical protein